MSQLIIRQKKIARTGHGAHGARRLGVALRRLVDPAEMLTAQLDGLMTPPS